MIDVEKMMSSNKLRLRHIGIMTVVKAVDKDLNSATFRMVLESVLD